MEEPLIAANSNVGLEPNLPTIASAGGSLKLYAEMMKSLDDGVGRVMQAIRAAGIDKKTLVIFTSDNGGERFSYLWPFSGQKGDLLEGGIRVPAIVRWPGVNKWNDQMLPRPPARR